MIKDRALAVFPVPGRLLWVAIVQTQPNPNGWAIGTMDSPDATEWHDCLSVMPLDVAVRRAAGRIDSLTAR